MISRSCYLTLQSRLRSLKLYFIFNYIQRRRPYAGAIPNASIEKNPLQCQQCSKMLMCTVVSRHFRECNPKLQLVVQKKKIIEKKSQTIGSPRSGWLRNLGNPKFS